MPSYAVCKHALAELVDYANEGARSHQQWTDLIRAVYYAAASSPFALQALLNIRYEWVKTQKQTTNSYSNPVALMTSIPLYRGEQKRLEQIQWHLDQWIQVTQTSVDSVPTAKSPQQDSQHRVLQVLRAVHNIVTQPENKILIFCRWSETHRFLEQILKRHYGSRRLAIFSASKSDDELQNEVDRFQSDHECQIMLCDESGGEGRNFQIATLIIHVDLPWMPAQIEQRIGRVDRLGRVGMVTSVVPYAQQTVESDLFRLWHHAFELFTHSMSGMEIVLESIQDDIAKALAENPRNGLANLIDPMTTKARMLRQIVEEERYAEESAAQNQRREKFAQTLEEYRDGEKLRSPLLKWAELAGMPSQRRGTAFSVFDPKHFNYTSIKNAKFVNPPNMQEALRRSGRQHKLEIVGTFNREIAVKREDVVFFAPGESWTDSLILNALHADRGKSCAIMREAPNLQEDWEGFECLYSIRVDPRPLYESGGDPVNLFHAQGYLTAPICRVAVSLDGELVKRSSVIWQHLQNGYMQSGDVHLGKRSGQNPPLKLFMERFPQWKTIVVSALAAAEDYVRTEYEFTSELAEEARFIFERKITGLRAAHRWLRGELSSAEIDEYERVTQLLVKGIAQPQIQLESVCFWWLRSS